MSCVSCGGISLDNLFWERSNASSVVNLSRDEGIELVSKLLDKLSNWIPFKFPMSFGISPSKLLLERSMAMKIYGILLYAVSKPLFVNVIE